MTSRRSAFVALTAGLAVVGLSVPACSKDTRDKLKDAGRSAQRDAEKLGRQGEARAAAEALRVALKAANAKDDKDFRSVANINHSVRTYVSSLPGNPKVSGIVDANKDGRDDDGKIQVSVGDKSACVVLPNTGSNTSVHNGRC